MATFDPRIGKPRWLTGSAANSLARKLRQLAFFLLVPPESFLVDTSHHETVLREGELTRAREWGALLGRDIPGQAV